MAFLLPGDPATPTGGYRYDRRIAGGLEALGWHPTVHPLDASFPTPDAAALAAARRVLEGLPDGHIVVVDGLALGGMPELVEAEAARLRLVGLVHHPLAAETGLEAALAERLGNAERRAWAAVARLIVTSDATARQLIAAGMAAERIGVVNPGTDPAAPAQGSDDAVPTLLCVATLTPRKGHALLLDALHEVRDRPWRLCCVGSLQRSPETAAALRRKIARLGLAERVELLGEVDEAMLEACYAAADLFVLPSYLEGYGMALAEALAHGLPVLGTRAGGIAETFPPEAGVLVPPGDRAALAGALVDLLDDPQRRCQLAAGARAAAAHLPTWNQASLRFALELERIIPP